MEYVKSPDVRKRAWIGYEQRMPTNAGILAKLLTVRQKISDLLGYKDWPQYQLEEKMAKDQPTVDKFLGDLKAKLLPLGKKEMGELLDLRTKLRKEWGLSEDPREYVSVNLPWRA
jgi:saccharolysin